MTEYNSQYSGLYDKPPDGVNLVTIVNLTQALDIKKGEVISLVGGGGKTTLMFALARELAHGGQLVITTTTTKILEPSSGETPLLLVGADEEKLMKAALDNLENYRHITLAAERLAQSKLRGVSPELVKRLAERGRVDYIIVEADGSARRPLKAPNATEPVIPDNTSLVVAVVGIDAVGRPLSEEHVFRSAIASQLLGKPIGETVTAQDVALLITHPSGIAKGTPRLARIIPFINKIDLEGGLAKGREVAENILARDHPQIERVVLGQAQSTEPVVEIMKRRTRLT